MRRPAYRGLLALALASADAALQRVTSLPGAIHLQGKHYSGYLDIDGSDLGVLEVFTYYVQHPDPDAPLLIWMNGGPGASSLMGLFTEIGPHLLNLQSVPKIWPNASAWRPFANPHAFSEEGSLLVWEQPAGVGFSRCLARCPALWDDTTSAHANAALVVSFLAQMPEAKRRDVYIVGESYAGIYVPLLAKELLKVDTMSIPLKGIMVGDGCIGFGAKGGCGIDSLDLFVGVMELQRGVDKAATAGARRECAGQLESGFSADGLSVGCAKAMSHLFVEVGEYNQYNMDSPCGPEGQGNWGDGTGFACANGALEKYVALPDVQAAMHVISSARDAPRMWQEWDGDSNFYNISLPDARPVYRALLAANVSTLIYSGLRDTAVPNIGAARWVGGVGGEVRTPRRKWGAPAAFGRPDGDLAGHVTVHESGLTYATVAGAGHLVPADRPVAARAMLAAWLRGAPLPFYEGLPCKRLWLGRGYGEFC